MFGISPATTGKASPKAVASATIFLLALLAGCTTHNTAQTVPSPAATVPSPETTVPSPAASNVCNADSDTFCLEGDKDSGARLNRQGLEYGAKKDYDQALGLFQQAIELDNSNPEFYYNLGVAYGYKQMPREAEATYIQGLEIKPGNPMHTRHFARIHFNLACLYALQGKKDRAFEHLEMVYAEGDTADNMVFHGIGSEMYRWIESDADLASLREDPRYKELLARHAKRHSSSEKAGTP